MVRVRRVRFQSRVVLPAESTKSVTVESIATVDVSGMSLNSIGVIVAEKQILMSVIRANL